MNAEPDSTSTQRLQPRTRGRLDHILALLGSYHIACVNFALIFIVTLAGTIYQKDSLFGLYDCQRYYFESWIVPRVAWVWGWLPLPGMALLFAVAFVNILAGGILRIRKNRRTVGVVIAHFSILGFIIASAVSLWTKVEGMMPVFEKGSESIVKAPHDWVLEVRELRGRDGRDPVDKGIRFIRDKLFHDCDVESGRTRKFTSGTWPFSLTAGGYVRNAEIVMENDPALGRDAPRAGGYGIRSMAVSSHNEMNFGAVRVELKDRDGKLLAAGLSAANEKAPFVFAAGDRRFAISMTRERWQVPFSIYLDDFRAEYYPGTRKARSYESDIVVRHENGNESKHHISMNNPLRDAGYVAYQTSYDSESPPGEEKYSVFTVVKNRTDQWPLYSLLVCMAGLLIHFLSKLTRFLDRSSRNQPPQAPAA